MTVTNWQKSIATSLLAAGLWMPSAAQGVNIPVPDSSFEAYVIPAAQGYAYAGLTANNYRPTSPWIGNPDGPDGTPIDGGPTGSNWLYNSANAEATDKPTADFVPGKKASPRTGNQAMHGRGFYSGQELPNAFEAGKTYTFSIYAQGDDGALSSPSDNSTSRVWLYIYNGGLPFTDPTALAIDRFSPMDSVNTAGPDDFVNRDPSWTAAQSKAAWQQISIKHRVLPGAPEVGQPIGIAFWTPFDGAVDDASLSSSGGLGDFNGDTLFNSLDWAVLRSNQLADLTAMTEEDAYLHGDIDGDGFNNNADFVLFKNAYEVANGDGSFTAMLASIPEPASAILAAAGGLVMLVRRRSK